MNTFLYRIRNAIILFPLVWVNLSAAHDWISIGLQNKIVYNLRITRKYIYACAERDGLFRIAKNNIGGDWEYLGLKETAANTNGVLDVAVNPMNEDEILVARAPSKSNVPGIFKSIDGGRSWSVSDSGFGFVVPWWFPADSGRLRAAQVLFIPPGQSDTVYAGSPWTDQVFRSTNFGIDWQIRGSGAGIVLFRGINTFAQDPSNPGTIWAGGYREESSTWLLRSTDNG